MLDVAIIGGGPAGAAAALSLRKIAPQAKLAIFDAARTNPFKPGETLSPAATSILDSLNCKLEEAFALPSFGTKAAWGSSDLYERDFLYSLHGNGWRLERARFEAMLLERAKSAGVEIHHGALLTESAEADAWNLTFHSKQVQARFVIDASGRAARFASQRGAKLETSDHLAAVIVVFQSPRPEDTLVEAAEEGWWYSTSTVTGRLIVAWMSDTDLIRGRNLKQMDCWTALLGESRHTKLRLEGAKPVTAPMIFAANSQRLSTVCGRGWVAAGDAAMTFDPLSSEGLTKALRSGKMASFVAADFLRGVHTHERYAALAAAECATYEAAKRSYYSEERRWTRSLFWARRISP